jgi:ABC-type sugar transport system permease subunit
MGRTTEDSDLMAKSERWTPYLFLLPAMLLLVLWRIVPLVAGLRESFYGNALDLTSGRQWVGLDNFRYIFQDPTFWKSVRVTLLFNLIVNPLQVVLAILLALIANQRVPGIAFFRTILLLPVAIAINIAALVWGLALDPNYGLVNGLLDAVGLARQPFLRSAAQALPTMIGIVSWIGVPFWMLFVLAGLQSIPGDLREAARIDGASRPQIFFGITLPLLRRVILFILVADTVVNFTLFAPPYLLTRGGPSQSTNLMMYDAWKRGFVYGDLGSSEAMVVVLLGMLCVTLAFQFAFLRPKD